MKKGKVSGYLIYLLCLVLVLLLFFYLIYMPVSSDVAKLDAKHAQNMEQITVLNDEIANQKKIKDKIAELEAKLDAAKKSASVNGSQVAEDAAKAWSAAGITPQTIQVGDETVVKDKTTSDGRPLTTVPVNITVACSKEQLQKLLNYFEKQSPGCYYVNSVQYAQGTQKSDTLTVNLSMTLYYFGAGAKTK